MYSSSVLAGIQMWMFYVWGVYNINLGHQEKFHLIIDGEVYVLLSPPGTTQVFCFNFIFPIYVHANQSLSVLATIYCG